MQAKLGKKGVVMTCLICHKKNRNARGCPERKKNQAEDERLDIPAPVATEVDHLYDFDTISH